MNLFLVQDLVGIQDWADLWPKIYVTIDRVLDRWASYSRNFMVVDRAEGPMAMGENNDMGLVIFNVWDGPIQLDLTT